MPIIGRSILFAMALALLPVAAAIAAAPPNPGDIAVDIRRDGEAFVVNVDFLVDSTRQQAWNVLTDYDHMAEFLSSMTASGIIRRDQDRIEVAQTGHVSLGPFEFKVENVREIEFVPLQEIRSKLIRGDMKASSFTTRLSTEGNRTRINYQGRFIPDRWIPPLIGTAVLEAQTRKQFAEFRAEILRRIEPKRPTD